MNKLWITVGSVFLAMAFPLTAMADSELQVKEKDGTSYNSGGVGNAEQDHLKQIADDFNLKVTMATDSGAYMGATSVHIENAANDEVLDLSTKGPILLVDLEPGTYQVFVDEAGKDASKKVTIKEGQQQQLVFRWDENLQPRAGDQPAASDQPGAGDQPAAGDAPPAAADPADVGEEEESEY